MTEPSPQLLTAAALGPAAVDSAATTKGDPISVLCRTANRVRRDVEHSVLRPAGLLWTTYDVLHLIVSHRRIDTRTVAATVGISKATVTVTVKTLTARQLVRRSVDTEDHRHVWLNATVAGWQALHDVRPRVLARQQQLLAGTIDSTAPPLLRAAATLNRLPGGGRMPGGSP